MSLFGDVFTRHVFIGITCSFTAVALIYKHIYELEKQLEEKPTHRSLKRHVSQQFDETHRQKVYLQEVKDAERILAEHMHNTSSDSDYSTDGEATTPNLHPASTSTKITSDSMTTFQHDVLL